MTKIFVMPDNADRAFLVTTQGVYKTTNGGTTWSQCYSKTNLTDIAYSTTYQTLFVSAYDGIFYSEGDSSTLGSTWTETEAGLTNQNCRSVAVDNVNNYVYTGTNGGGIYRAKIQSTAVDNTWILYE